MKKSRTVISVLASAIMLASLAGCRNTENPSTPTTISVTDNIISEPSGETSEPTSTNVGSNETSDNVTSQSGQSGEVSQPHPVTELAPDGEKAGSVFVCSDGRGIPLFGGGTGANYISAINEVKKQVGSQVNVFSMIVPTSGSFYMPKGYEDYTANEWDCIQRINAQFVGIIPVDAYTALSKHTNEEIYSRTDHHWNQLGAYYAAEEFTKTAMIDVPFAPLSSYERHDIEGYLGSLYKSSNQNTTMRDHPETFTYYIPPNEFTTLYMNPEDKSFWQASMFVKQGVMESYSTFMGGDMKVVHITTDVKNGRKLLIIKDSYPNALVPCLTGSFQEIWTADMRYLKDMKHFPHSISQIVRENGITDVLFCMNTFSAVGDNADYLALYLSEQWVEEITPITSETTSDERGQ